MVFIHLIRWWLIIGSENRVFQAAQGASGYYYVTIAKEFKGVTAQELEVRFDLASELIAEKEDVNEKYIYYENKSYEYTDFTRYEVFYVKHATVNLGKLTFVIQEIGDKYDLSMVFSEHKIVPRSATQALKSTRKHRPYKPYTETELDKKSRRRYINRRWRHNQRHRTSGDTKSED